MYRNLKINRSRLLAGIYFLIIMIGVTGCGVIKKKEKTNTVKIGIAIYRGDDAFISSLCTALENEVKLIEEQKGEKITIQIVDAKNSQSSQNDQVDNFISKGYDAICVNMVDRTAAAVIVDKAKEADIPIIFFNREPVEDDLKIWDREYYVGTDAREAGRFQGEMILDLCRDDIIILDKNGDGKLQYIMLEGEQTHQDSLIRTEYSVKTIVEAGIEMDKLGSGTGNWLRSPAYEHMKTWIEDYGEEIELIISNNDEMALGVIEALMEKNMLEGGPVIVGIDGTKDGLEAVYQERLLGTVLNDAKGQANAMLEIAYSCARGEDPQKQSGINFVDDNYVWIEHYKVTKENVDEFLK